MLVLGLTGNIGSGKTTVGKLLAQAGVPVLDSDQVGHEALSPGGVAHDAVLEAFGEVFLQEDGTLNRKSLGKYIFSDTTGYLREQLNDITHPLILDYIKKWLEEQRAAGNKAAVVESALLIRSGLNELVDKIWLVQAPRETMIQRAMARDNAYETSVTMRLNAQMSQEEMAAYADVILDNDGSIEQLTAKVKEEYDKLLKELA